MSRMARGKKRKPLPKPVDSGQRGPGRQISDTAVAGELQNSLEDTLGYRRVTGEGLSDAELKERHADDVRRALRSLTDEEINAAIVAAGGTKRRDRTLRRWRQRGQIPARVVPAPDDGKPRPSVEELVYRRAAVKELGGVDEAASKLGRKKRSVQRWMTGETKSFSKEAKTTMHKHRVVTAARRHAVAPKKQAAAKTPPRATKGHPAAPKPAPPAPKFRVTGMFAVVDDGNEYPARFRTIDMTTVGWPEEDVDALLFAVREDDTAKVQELIERALTERYMQGAHDHEYNENNHMRVESIERIDFYFEGGGE
ncbi:hypothetical protein [Tsukamurella hominis]|uniref:hypothetical protein n=1 Tax=Tsukamurella hominis TaxID=1970232 RepID=UPI0039EC5973